MTNLQFTPDSALAGGLILGSMVVAKRLNSGRNLGVSGDTKAFARGEGRATSAAFLIGLLAAGYAAPMILGAQAAVPMVDATRAIAAGALVGAGSSLGGGCTSGHGIAGIGRLSARSVAFTCVFMVVGAITVAATGTMDELHVSQATKTIDMLARSPEAKTILYAKIFAAGAAIQGVLYALAKREGGGITDVVKKLEARERVRRRTVLRSRSRRERDDESGESRRFSRRHHSSFRSVLDVRHGWRARPRECFYVPREECLGRLSSGHGARVRD